MKHCVKTTAYVLKRVQPMFDKLTAEIRRLRKENTELVMANCILQEEIDRATGWKRHY